MGIRKGSEADYQFLMEIGKKCLHNERYIGDGIYKCRKCSLLLKKIDNNNTWIVDQGANEIDFASLKTLILGSLEANFKTWSQVKKMYFNPYEIREIATKELERVNKEIELNIPFKKRPIPGAVKDVPLLPRLSYIAALYGLIDPLHFNETRRYLGPRHHPYIFTNGCAQPGYPEPGYAKDKSCCCEISDAGDIVKHSKFICSDTYAHENKLEYVLETTKTDELASPVWNWYTKPLHYIYPAIAGTKVNVRIVIGPPLVIYINERALLPALCCINYRLTPNVIKKSYTDLPKCVQEMIAEFLPITIKIYINEQKLQSQIQGPFHYHPLLLLNKYTNLLIKNLMKSRSSLSCELHYTTVLKNETTTVNPYIIKLFSYFKFKKIICIYPCEIDKRVPLFNDICHHLHTIGPQIEDLSLRCCINVNCKCKSQALWKYSQWKSLLISQSMINLKKLSFNTTSTTPRIHLLIYRLMDRLQSKRNIHNNDCFLNSKLQNICKGCNHFTFGIPKVSDQKILTKKCKHVLDWCEKCAIKQTKICKYCEFEKWIKLNKNKKKTIYTSVGIDILCLIARFLPVIIKRGYNMSTGQYGYFYTHEMITVDQISFNAVAMNGTKPGLHLLNLIIELYPYSNNNIIQGSSTRTLNKYISMDQCIKNINKYILPSLWYGFTICINKNLKNYSDDWAVMGLVNDTLDTLSKYHYSLSSLSLKDMPIKSDLKNQLFRSVSDLIRKSIKSTFSYEFSNYQEKDTCYNDKYKGFIQLYNKSSIFTNNFGSLNGRSQISCMDCGLISFGNVQCEYLRCDLWQICPNSYYCRKRLTSLGIHYIDYGIPIKMSDNKFYHNLCYQRLSNP